MKLKPYPTYKDSGLPWLGAIPAHWETERARWLFTRMQRPVRPSDEVVTCFRDGTVTLRKNRRVTGFTESLKEIGYQGIRQGDLVIHAMDAFAGAIGVSDSDGKGTPVYAVCQPKEYVNSHYFAHVVREMSRTQYLTALARGIRERSTDFRFETFASLFVPLPSRQEQNAVATFLSQTDRLINRLVRAKRRLIEVLTEQKQAIIHRAVTRGLDPNVRLKPSGIDWFGDVPEHWEVRRAKDVCSAIVDCKNRTPLIVENGKYIVIRTSNVRDGKLDLSTPTLTDEANYRIWTQRGAPRFGDVFFTREAPAGEACLVPENENLCLGQRMMYFRPASEKMLSAFLLLSIYGPVVRRYVELACNGSTVGHLRIGQVSALPLLWCPLSEQKAIVELVNDESQRIDTAIAKAKREIELLREYRTRLIADVVTGKLDVRGVELPAMENGEPFDELESATDADSGDMDEAEEATDEE